MSTLASLLRKCSSVQDAEALAKAGSKESKKAVKAAELLAKEAAKLDEAFADKSKFVRIIRSQLALLHFPFVTFSAVNERAQEGDLDACEFIMEFCAQEQADLVKAGMDEDFVSDEEITNLWAHGVVLSRIASMDPKPVHSWYVAQHADPEKNERKLFVRVAHIARALAAAEQLELPKVTAFLEMVLSYYSATFKIDDLASYDPDWDLERKHEG